MPVAIRFISHLTFQSTIFPELNSFEINNNKYTMRSTIVHTLALVAPIVGAAPIDKPSFPLANGFPNPNQDQILQIQMQAHGTLPNGPPPPTLSPDGVTNLKLIAFNELFEVQFFTELLTNVTNEVEGYKLDKSLDKNYVVDVLNTIVNQEELHLLNANGALKHFNQEPIQPCKYNFPVSDFSSAIKLAATFTDMVLGTLQDVNQVFAKNGDDGLVRAVSSVIGNEGEQEGFFRLLQKKRPSAQPFLTTAVRDFAFTAIQGFVVPGSCPNIGTIPLKTFKSFSLDSQNIQPLTQSLKFSFDKKDGGLYSQNDMRLVYINGQNTPVVKTLDNWQDKGDKIAFEAVFPYDEFVMDGLTIAAITVGKTSFADANEVAAATVFGPQIIEFD